MASGLLLVDAAAIIALLVHLFFTTGFHGNAIAYLMNISALPLAVYGIWALGLFGTVGALVAIGLYGFRARWFWWCLMIAAVAWLVFPPIHSLLGLVGFILLLCSRKTFFEARTGAVSPV